MRSATTPTPHPNMASASPRRLELELSTTQRIIENLLGVSTTFFRPPYNADSDPQTPEEILPLLRAQAAGYTTVAETIDPRDWQPGVTADAIVSEVRIEIGNGHIILLHDAGGDRTRHRAGAAEHHRSATSAQVTGSRWWAIWSANRAAR